MCLNFVGDGSQKWDREIESCRGVRSNIYRLHLDLVVNVFQSKNDEMKNSSGLQFKA